MLDGIPLARAGRKVAHMNVQSSIVGQSLEFGFEALDSMAVAPTAVGGEIEGSGPRISLLAHEFPPSPHAHQSEFRRVMAHPDIDESLMRGHIIDSIGIDLPLAAIGKIIDGDRREGLLGMPFTTRVAEIPHEFFFLGIDGNDGVPRGLKGHGLVMNPLKLGIAVGVVAPYALTFHKNVVA